MQKFDPEQLLSEARREFGPHGDVNPSVSRSSTFTVSEPCDMADIFKGIKGPDADGCYLYSRHGNPTVKVLARYLAAMEGTEAAHCTASGMSAISCTLSQLCKTGDHIVASDTIYGGTHALLGDLFPEMAISTTFVDVTDLSAVAAAIQKTTRVIYVETVGNPTLKVADIPALSKLAREKGILLVVDNTFTPMIFSPARLGADMVLYSMSKFINGASDAIAGAVCAGSEFIGKLVNMRTGRAMLLGPTLDARTAFDLIQRLPYLALRMREHGRRALAIASRLEDSGVTVRYPGLSSHPQYRLFRSMMNEGYGYGGMLTVDCGTVEKAEALMRVLQNQEHFGLLAVSLGYYDTLISCSGSSTSSEIPPESQRAIGLSPGLVRFSVGITGSLESRLAQITRAIKTVGLA
ncbi:MAG: aminotransferase class I/II-fold pyridoxal phosphate-dependent enzyme [Desulfobacterales bacterium]|jgi:methionine-gamma-lyase|nr:aminotransferase class I/II-fold pyridoxal phosphate-dependent enzyme [Desulfobacterales bacterium]